MNLSLFKTTASILVLSAVLVGCRTSQPVEEKPKEPAALEEVLTPVAPEQPEAKPAEAAKEQ